MKKGAILIIDDESAFLRLSSKWLEEKGFSVETAGDAGTALFAFKTGRFDLVLLDLSLPPSSTPEEGLSLLGSFGAVPVVVLTGHGERELALKAVGSGAWDFLHKPVDPDMLEVVIERALVKRNLEEEVSMLRRTLASGPSDPTGIVGNSRPIRELRNLVRRIAPSSINVMIMGPSGTGKESVARAMHALSPRRDKPFMPVHCGAIPSELLESELFGHTKGAFTGADKDKLGLIEAANNGVLFLDEAGEMPPSMQVKLLRFLQDGTYLPVGGRIEKKADVRIISATNRDLDKMIAEGTFREDLYYRLKGIVIRTRPLKDHMEDLPLLAMRFLKHAADGAPRRLPNGVMAWLMKQPWNGNVRELKNIIESATALSTGKDITIEDVQMAMHGTISEEKITDERLGSQIDALEKKLILAALEETGRNHSETARRLGVSRAGLLKKMKRLDI